MSTVDGGRAAALAALPGRLWSARVRGWAELHEQLHTPGCTRRRWTPWGRVRHAVARPKLRGLG